MFAEHGLEAPLETIAAEAGVGIATRYRRFPIREDLLGAIVDEELEAYHEVLDHALGRVDAWDGFSDFSERMCRLHARSPGLCDAPYLTLPGDRIDQRRLPKPAGAHTRVSLWCRPRFSRSIRRGRTTTFGRGGGWKGFVA